MHHRPLLIAVAALAALSVDTALAESTKTLRAELPAQGGFGVENLVGHMRVTPGDSDAIVVTATVYGESDDLAAAVRLERVSGDGGPTLRVRYPYDRVHTFRYRESENGWDGFFGFGSSSTYSYDGRNVHVNPGRGTRLYADVEVSVPKHEVNGLFRNLVGRLDAEGVEGHLRFDVESADLRLARLKGELVFNGSSGDIRARDIQGSWRSDFSSGDCRLENFSGESFSFRATSGDLDAHGVKTGRLQTETSSGDVRLIDADAGELAIEATSGDVELQSSAHGLRSADIHTSSGDVVLRIPAEAAFDLETTQSSGDTHIGFNDGAAMRQDGRHATFRRGAGGPHIRVRTSSGDLSVRPL